MVLIHDAVERVVSCGPGGIIEERNEGYEIYEHYEQIHVRIYTTIEGGRDRTLNFQLTHAEMASFCRLYEKYREADMARERTIMKHVLQAVLLGTQELFAEYYRQNRVEMAALKMTLPMFMEVCGENQRNRKQKQPATSYLRAS